MRRFFGLEESVRGKTRPFTWVLFALFLLSAGGIKTLSGSVSSSVYFYEINPFAKSISNCQNDDLELAGVLSKVTTSAEAFQRLSWKDGQLVNPTSSEISGCLLVSKEGDQFRVRCLGFDSLSEKTSEKIFVGFNDEKQCWDDRDLTYLKNIDELYEKNSLPGLVQRFQTWL